MSSNKSLPHISNAISNRRINRLSLLLMSFLFTTLLCPNHANASSSLSTRRYLKGNHHHNHHKNNSTNASIAADPTLSPISESNALGRTEDIIEDNNNAQTEGPTTTNPTENQTVEPTASPVEGKTAEPTASPTTSPTASPIVSPTLSPTKAPTSSPTVIPSSAPSFSPSLPFFEREKAKAQAEEKEIERIVRDPTAEIMAGVIALIAILGMLITAQQILEKPDGLCASCCRCSLTFCTLCIKFCCIPCSLICGYKYNGYTGSDPNNKAVFLQAEEYTDDLELT